MKFNNLNDFPVISNDIEWNPLKIRKHVSQLEREIGFIKDFGKKVVRLALQKIMVEMSLSPASRAANGWVCRWG
jgi:hypothetical protein